MSYSPVPALVAVFGAAVVVAGVIVGFDDGDPGFILCLVGAVVLVLGIYSHFVAVKRGEFERKLKLYEDGVIDEPPTR